MSQIKVNKNENRPSIFKKTNSSTSIISQLANEKANKRISFQGDNEDHIINFEGTTPTSDKIEGSFKEHKMHRISEERRGDFTVSSTSSVEPRPSLDNIISETRGPNERKKAFMVSQLGVDNPTFNDGNSSYVLDPMTMTTNRINSYDECEKL